MCKRNEAISAAAVPTLGKVGLMVLTGAILAGCAHTPGCLKSQRYANATAFPKLKSPAGLTLPKVDTDMQIPSASNGPISAYAKAPPGTDPDNPRSRCLTTPPPLSASG